ncbi:Calcium and integrin-binding protein 1 [Anthophora retusa]
MGNFSSRDRILDEELLNTYAELTYLGKSEIKHIVKLLDDVDPGKLRKNLQHRFTTEQVGIILPQIQCSPFCDSIYRVFSSKKDGHLSLEDILDLCSIFSRDCVKEVRATWAFYIFDFDGDNQISLADLMEAVRRLTWNDQDEYESIDTTEAEHIARMVLQEMVFNQHGSISLEEFIRFSSRVSEFSSAFHFKI